MFPIRCGVELLLTNLPDNLTNFVLVGHKMTYLSMNVPIFPIYTIFYHHLQELKLRLIYIIFSFFLSFFICYYYCFQVIYVFAKPLLRYTNKFMFTDLTEAL